MMRKYRKSFFGASAIIVGVAIFAFVIIIILAFFLSFKYQITLVIREQYLWNKVQEVPLDLFSMDIDGESFVSRMNKVYHGFDDKDALRDAVDNFVTKQLFYSLEEENYFLEANVKVGGMRITKPIGCRVIDGHCNIFGCDCLCSDNCGDESGEYIGFASRHTSCDVEFDLSNCITELPKGAFYRSILYPFPLTFDGTDVFVDELFQEIIEVERG